MSDGLNSEHIALNKLYDMNINRFINNTPNKHTLTQRLLSTGNLR